MQIHRLLTALTPERLGKCVVSLNTFHLEDPETNCVIHSRISATGSEFENLEKFEWAPTRFQSTMNLPESLRVYGGPWMML